METILSKGGGGGGGIFLQLLKMLLKILLIEPTDNIR